MSTSSDPYRIRLRGPWEIAPLASGGRGTRASGSAAECEAEQQLPLTPIAPEFETVDMPASWRELFGDESGTVLFRRRFNRPTHLEPHQRLSIALTDVAGAVSVRVNGALRAVSREPRAGPRDSVLSTPHSALCYDITDVLQDYNLLEVEITFDPRAAPDNPGGLWQPVVLEISPSV